MLRYLLDILISIVTKLPFVKKQRPRARRIGKKTENLLLKYPILLFGAIGFVLILLLWTVYPNPRCYLVNIEALAGKEGDQLVNGRDRPCAERSIVAIEHYSWANNSITASIHINGLALEEVRNKSTWRGLDIFGTNTKDWWTAEFSKQEFFLKGGCGFPNDDSNKPLRELRSGVLLTSDVRYDRRKLSQEEKQWCGWRATDPKCYPGRYQEFIQSELPNNWCTAFTFWDTFFDRLWLRGTKKRYLVEGKPDLLLKANARNRFEEGKQKVVSKEEWEKLTEGMPPLCIRWKPDTARAEEWETQAQAKIAAVWCDY